MFFASQTLYRWSFLASQIGHLYSASGAKTFSWYRDFWWFPGNTTFSKTCFSWESVKTIGNSCIFSSRAPRKMKHFSNESFKIRCTIKMQTWRLLFVKCNGIVQLYMILMVMMFVVHTITLSRYMNKIAGTRQNTASKGRQRFPGMR